MSAQIQLMYFMSLNMKLNFCKVINSEQDQIDKADCFFTQKGHGIYPLF